MISIQTRATKSVSPVVVICPPLRREVKPACEKTSRQLGGLYAPQGFPRPLVGVALGYDESRHKAGARFFLVQQQGEELQPHLRGVVRMAVCVRLEEEHSYNKV